RPALEPRQQRPRRLSLEEGAFADLKWDACLEECLLVERRAEVDAIEDGDLAQRNSLPPKRAYPLSDERGLVLVRLLRADHRLRPRGPRGPQGLRSTAQARRQPVRDRENLR